jgi:DNA helicase-2/ATP-dependent DNA helicase PcrA
MLHESDRVAAQVRAQYKHFVVDEFQDVSPLQHTLLQLWLGDSDDLCVVGDPAQSIHAFAGADRKYLMEFSKWFPGAEELSLVRNYRSVPTVLCLANALSQRYPAQIGAVKLQPVRTGESEIRVHAYSDEDAEADAVVAWVQARHTAGAAWDDIAILYRINAQSPGLEARLAAAGIPYVVRNAERFYERPEVRRALVGLHAQLKVSADAPGLETFEAVLSGMGWSAEAPQETGHLREQWESWQALVNLARGIDSELGNPSAAELAAELDSRAAAQEIPTADGVSLSTLHSAKGLEWDSVAIIGVQEGTIPFVLAETPEQLAEENRLLYVGITRAKNDLRISWSASGPVRRHRTASRFLQGLGLAQQRFTQTGRRKDRKSKKAAKCRVCGKLLESGPELKLGRHLDCQSNYDEKLLETLKSWRLETAHEAEVPAYVVFTDATLVAIAESLPTTPDELLAISGLGPRKLELYGDTVLTLIQDHEAADKPKS